MQVRYIGLETAVAHGKHDKLLSDNSTESNLILALAKERIQEMDFIGKMSQVSYPYLLCISLCMLVLLINHYITCLLI